VINAQSEGGELLLLLRTLMYVAEDPMLEAEEP
jgi:hypothetical protein